MRKSIVLFLILPMITWLVVCSIQTKEERDNQFSQQFMQDYIITEQIMKEFNEPEELKEKYFRLTHENTQYPFARFRIDKETYLQYYVYSVIHRYPPFAIALFERKDSLSYIFNFNDEMSIAEGRAGSGNIEMRFNQLIDTLGFSRDEFMIMKLIERVFGGMMGLKSHSEADLQVILHELSARRYPSFEKFKAEVDCLPNVNWTDTFLFESYQGSPGYWLVQIVNSKEAFGRFEVKFRFIGSSVYSILYI